MLPQPARRSSAPTAAERARTLLEFASSAVLDIRGADLAARPGLPSQVACAPRPDGSVAVLVGRESALHRITALARGPLTAELDCVDVAPVAVPHRIRGRLQIQGLLTSAPGETPAAFFPRAGHAARHDGGVLLRLEPDHLALDDLWGAECCVDPDETAAAEPDPVAAEEPALLQHLAAAHADQLLVLGSQALDRPVAPPGWDTATDRLREVRPVALDRRGLRVRLLGVDPGTVLDARFEFHRPVGHSDDLPEALHRLFAHAAAPTLRSATAFHPEG
ncbi:DUF2470 domain-containing protein [Streptomyces sp. TLI_171]|uniref:DUF2470 domain-containing protein n=1 Tax=Streptomyces sp. TLI_171 TaxID=1938859 RepID=UPI000C190E19|nr:DUF2470 domain-containing protein [Streptomyces sp. TLI_171]RKE18395.1 hypothetical protein BX266_1685 [Streptomyces sp. TLI_171]